MAGFLLGMLVMVLPQRASAIVDPYTIKSSVPIAEKAITPYGTDLFGDQVSLYNGGLSFQQTDLSLKGNNALPVALTRTTSLGMRSRNVQLRQNVGDWAWQLPRVTGAIATTQGWRGYDGSVARCSKYDTPPEVLVLNSWIAATSYWQGYYLDIPGAGRQELLSREAAYTAAPFTGGPYPLVTAKQW